VPGPILFDVLVAELQHRHPLDERAAVIGRKVLEHARQPLARRSGVYRGPYIIALPRSTTGAPTARPQGSRPIIVPGRTVRLEVRNTF
jgi:hypothetical protein